MAAQQNTQADGQVVIDITANTSGVNNAMQDVSSNAQRVGNQIENNVRQTTQESEGVIKKGLKNITAAISAAAIAKKLFDFGKAAVEAASNLQEVNDVMETTFGTGSSHVDAWAKNAIKQFGMTEAKAKQFASSAAAALKSWGVQGDQIVEMSESIAGLAADMASFYNIDYDTAFQKLRSGLIGQAGPLKELGINMSNAALEAFALSKGLDKTFSKMSQSEQTMLRYEYLMQETANVQGEFASSSDKMGANLQLLDAQMETFKTSIGNYLITPVTGALQAVNDLLAVLAPSEKKQTILDDFAAINLDTETKNAKIEATANKARDLIGMLETITGSDSSVENVAGSIAKITGSVNSLNSNKADALEKAVWSNNVTKTKASAWNDLMTALANNSDALSQITASTGQGVGEFLHNLSQEAATLDEKDVESWERLYALLTAELPQSSDTKEGETFAGLLESEVGKEAGQVSEAAANLDALGVASESVENAQAKWLEVCKRLTQTIPGISSIVNTQTGDVKGGTQALRDYVDEWEKAQIYMNKYAALEKKQSIYDSKYNLTALEVEAEEARRAADRANKVFNEYLTSSPVSLGTLEMLESYKKTRDNQKSINGWKAGAYYGLNSVVDDVSSILNGLFGFDTSADDELLQKYEIYLQALDEAEAAEKNLAIQTEARAQATADLNAEWEELKNTSEATAYASITHSQEQIDAWNEQLATVNELTQAVADYYQAVRDETKSTVDSVIKGFDMVETPAQKALNDLQEMGDITDDVRAKYQQNIPTISNILAGLQSQLDYMNEYQAMLDRAKAVGVSGDILAFLSDGSQESYDYLRAIVGERNMSGDWENAATGEDIDKLNEKWAEVNKGRETFTDDLTQTKLAVDDTFTSMVTSAQEAINNLNLEAEAKDAIGSTVEGIADGIKTRIPAVAEQVDALATQLARLQSFGVALNFGSGVSHWYDAYSGYEILQSVDYDHTHASGLDYVPYDGYLAQLHQGETVLTAEESSAWRAMRLNAGNHQNGFDYSAMSSAVWDGAPSLGGNVYLDGRTVGRVINDRQADNYRALTRSGWQQ